MPFIQLATVKHRVVVGVPLPFNVRNADETLLLARGQVVGSSAQMQSLFERGTLVDLAELQSLRDRVLDAHPEQLPALWQQSMARVAQVLRSPPEERFDAVLDDVAEPLVALIERDPDLAIFQVLRQDGNLHTQYGVNHSVHCAIAVFLTAHRLGWESSSVQKGFKAALTMNLSMLELQGQMATQMTPLTEAQREAIHSHPTRSVLMLEKAGIRDADWLRAVAQHHELPDGSGYPAGVREVSELAAILRRCDVYTAKLSPRRSREALAADLAARELFSADPGNPLTIALVKEFGVYPPGCFVKLASGVTGVVIKRGPTVQTPVVAMVTTPHGVPLSEPQRCETVAREHAIVGVAGSEAQRLPLVPEKLVRLACT